jgi:hypothetical protein
MSLYKGFIWNMEIHFLRVRANSTPVHKTRFGARNASIGPLAISGVTCSAFFWSSGYQRELCCDQEVQREQFHTGGLWAILYFPKPGIPM